MTGPAWGYRLEDGEIVPKLFEDGVIPDGWHDSPAKCVKPRRRKTNDDDGS